MLRGAERISKYSMDALDNIVGIAPDGRREALVLRSGSVVLQRFAFLRLRFADGRSHVELLKGDAATSPDWQRLQLTWRMRRRVVGGQDGS